MKRKIAHGKFKLIIKMKTTKGMMEKLCGLMDSGRADVRRSNLERSRDSSATAYLADCRQDTGSTGCGVSAFVTQSPLFIGEGNLKQCELLRS